MKVFEERLKAAAEALESKSLVANLPKPQITNWHC